MAQRSRPSRDSARPGLWLGRLAHEYRTLSPRARWGVWAGTVVGAAAAPVTVLQSGAGSALGAPVPGIGPALLLTGLGFAVFGGCTVWLAITDARSRRLPNAIVLLATAGLTIPLSLASLLWERPGWLGLAWMSAAGVFALTLSAWLWTPKLWGGGDVKLSFSVGFLAGWVLPVASLLLFPLACLLALTLSGLVALARQRRDFPFGPQLLGAGWLVALAGPQIWRLIGN